MNSEYLAKSLIIELLENGYEAYLVGGCVRDKLLSKIPNDWDICSSALPEEILKIFENRYTVFKKGKKHGTIGVKKEDQIFEITTYRIDKEYLDNRRPQNVEFTDNLEEDLKRRDFTINAMAMDIENRIIDPFGGQKDLKDKFIRTVGSADERFEEDALRILRAIRFASQLKFKITSSTYKGIERKRENLKNISADRIRDEFNKIILSDKPSYGIKLLVKTGLIDFIIPELKKGIGFDQKSPFHDKDVFEHTMDVLDRTSSDLNTRLSALLHDIAKPVTFSIDERGVGHFYGHNSVGRDMSIEIMRRLNYSKKDIAEVSNLVNYHMAIHDMQSSKSVKRLSRKIGNESIEKLIKLYEADKSSTLDRDNNIPGDKFKEIFERIKNYKEPLSRKDLAINGNNLLDMGIEKGKNLSIILEALVEYVLEYPDKNTVEDLEREAKSIALYLESKK